MEEKLEKVSQYIKDISNEQAELAAPTLSEINKLMDSIRTIFKDIIKINSFEAHDKRFESQLKAYQKYSNHLQLSFKVHDDLESLLSSELPEEKKNDICLAGKEILDMLQEEYDRLCDETFSILNVAQGNIEGGAKVLN